MKQTIKHPEQKHIWTWTLEKTYQDLQIKCPSWLLWAVPKHVLLFLEKAKQFKTNKIRNNKKYWKKTETPTISPQRLAKPLPLTKNDLVVGDFDWTRLVRLGRETIHRFLRI